MDPSSTHHHQLEMSSQTLESMLVCTTPQEEKKATRPAEQGMKCPRCDSTNTKFCYYNNYSLTQPRYFCKSCRRYWTKGGTLRNVPVGGGCRKNKRSSSKRTLENPTFLTTPTNDNNSSNSILSSLAPSLSYDYSTDLSVAFAMLQQKQHNNNGHQMGFEDYEFPMMGYNNNNNNNLSSVNNGYENNFYNTVSNNHGQTSHFDNGGSLGTINNGGDAFVKQEDEQSSNRILWGFPWQINGGDANIMAATNGYGSTWQGLINSPLI